MGNYITTYTGIHFELVDPKPDMIRIEDIAHALSLICRGNGQVRTFWSVGQHCINCANEAWARGLSNRIALACLLHDASECYLSDVPRPLKMEMTDYRKREDALLDMIYVKFLGSALTPEEKEQVKEIDDAMLWYDLDNLLDEEQFGDIPDLNINLDYSLRPFQEVEMDYLKFFYQYSGEEMPRPVYLKDIAEAFEACMDEWSQFLNTKTGEIISLPNDSVMLDIEDEDEELWEEIENSDYFIRLPEQYELHEKRIMEDFAQTCAPVNVAKRLWKVLNGRHPYRNFKDVINETDLAQQYYDFRYQNYLRMAEEWCRENKVRYFTGSGRDQKE